MTRAEKIRAGMERAIHNKKRASAMTSAAEEALARVAALETNSADVEERVVGDKSVVGAMAIGNDSYRLYTNGAIDVEKGKRIYEHNPSLVKTYEELQEVCRIDGIPLFTGLTVIFGGANEGKSPILRHIANRSQGTSVNCRAIRYGEPFPGYVRDTASLAAAILELPSGSAGVRVVTIDSLKNVVGRLGGSATSGGLSRELFPWLSDVSSFLAEIGVALVTVLNVSSARKLVVDEVVEGLHSNTVATWYVSDGQVTWQCRLGEGRKRAQGVATVIWGGDGQIDRLHPVSGDYGGKDAWSPTSSRLEDPSQFRYETANVGSVRVDVMSRAISRVMRAPIKNKSVGS